MRLKTSDLTVQRGTVENVFLEFVQIIFLAALNIVIEMIIKFPDHKNIHRPLYILDSIIFRNTI